MEKIIEIKNLEKKYLTPTESLHVLRGINLDIDRGDIISIMGPSGSGKSTLLNILGLLETFDQGEYHLAGIDVKLLGENERRIIRLQKIGFVFQTFNLIQTLTVRDNIELPMALLGKSQPIQHKRTDELLELLGITSKVNSFPFQLSIGEQQRVAFARAMVNDPHIILCDEPTGNLDANNAGIIMDYLRKLESYGATILIVTHNPELQNISKKNYILRNGHLNVE